MTYAHYISQTEVAYPDYALPPFAGVPNARTNDALHRVSGYLPLTGEPSPREGYTVSLTAFALNQTSETRREQRPHVVPDYDQETGEQTGSHTEWRWEEITVDTSTISVEAYEYVPVVPPAPSVEDYDIALEDYIREVRTARGYTDREPTDYANSTVQRWRQDAVDYTEFRDAVMVYGLGVMNDYAESKPVPTLDEFKAHLRTIECHWTYEG